MGDLVNDIKAVKIMTTAIKWAGALKTALTVGIIVFSVLEGIRYSLSPEMMKKTAVKQ